MPYQEFDNVPPPHQKFDNVPPSTGGYANNLSAAEQQPPQERMSKYETALPIRIDAAAALTYIFGPISGILFLILEYKNDYVRFNAWQSCILFTPLMILDLIFAFASMTAFIVFLVLEILLIIFLGFRAYQNGQTLERFELPFIGPIASRWVDSENN